MSEYQKEIYRKLTSASEQIDKHIVRLLIFPNCRYEKHWKDEIFAFLSDINKLKGKNKWPKAKFIKDALAVHNDILQSYIYFVTDVESQFTPVNVELDVIESAVEDYQDWIAAELSTKGYVRLSEVHTKLDEILKKYQK